MCKAVAESTRWVSNLDDKIAVKFSVDYIQFNRNIPYVGIRL